MLTAQAFTTLALCFIRCCHSKKELRIKIQSHHNPFIICYNLTGLHTTLHLLICSDFVLFGDLIRNQYSTNNGTTTTTTKSKQKIKFQKFIEDGQELEWTEKCVYDSTDRGYRMVWHDMAYHCMVCYGKSHFFSFLIYEQTAEKHALNLLVAINS